MIIQLVITWFAELATWIFGLFPDWDPPDVSSWASSASSVWSFVGWLNQYLPLDIALVLLVSLVAIYLGNYVLKITIWLFTKLHVLGGAD